MPRKEMVGKKFGKLTVIKKLQSDRQGYKYRVRCSCGNEFDRYGYALRRYANIQNRIQQCRDCYAKRLSSLKGSDAPAFRHGKTGSRIYKAWNAMIQRCTNSNHIQWKDYGGRGITFDEKWRKFSGFFEDMGEELEKSEGDTIERIDVEKPYRKSNCRWATQLEQARNKRKTVFVTLNGVTKAASEWDEIKGYRGNTVASRIRRNWTPERAINTKPKKRNNA